MPSKEESLHWLSEFSQSLRRGCTIQLSEFIFHWYSWAGASRKRASFITVWDSTLSDRHTVTINFLRYTGRLAKPLHTNPTFSKLLFAPNTIRAFSLLNAVYMVIASLEWFRLFSSGSSPDITASSTLSSKEEKEALEEMRLPSGA
jgi:hypothetical protein